MQHVPLKVLRGQQDEEDIHDQYHERFRAPGTATEDDNNDKDVDDDSLRSRLSNEDGTTDMDKDSDGSIERYLGRHTDSANGANPFGNDSNEGYQNVQVVARVHGLISTNVTSNNSLSNDETTPLLNKEH